MVQVSMALDRVASAYLAAANHSLPFGEKSAEPKLLYRDMCIFFLSFAGPKRSHRPQPHASGKQEQRPLQVSCSTRSRNMDILFVSPVQVVLVH